MLKFYNWFNSIAGSTALICIFSAATSLAGSFDEKLFPAFPGAEGAGAYTRGGRGGKVLFVTTPLDYREGREKPIPGSLRAAVKTRGPRIIVFRTGGTIELKTDLDIDEPYLTIAGQSAPGGGICLKDGSLKIHAPQVVVRYLRVRPGDLQRRELDAISCREQNIILDHCSASWGIDETISTNGNAANVTVGWCLIVESLNHSVHHKGSHGYGSLISGPGEISYHHNVYAYHRSRSPRAGDVLLDFRNNLIAGWGDRAGYSGPERLRMNYIGNYLRQAEYSKTKNIAFTPGGLSQRYYLEGNYFAGYPAGTADNWLLIKAARNSTADATRRALKADHVLPTTTVTTDSAADAYQNIMIGAGAVLPVRDAADRRVLEQIENGTGRLIDSQADVGGWPQLSAGEPPTDTDADGMPDVWEMRYGLAPDARDSSSEDKDGDGYPDLEEFLNDTDPTVPEPWIDPPAVSSSAGDAFLGNSQITIASATKGAEVFYTIDESEPTRSSSRYGGSFTLDHAATVRARAFLNGRASHVRNARFEQLTMHRPVVAPGARTGLRYEYFEHIGGDEVPDDLDALEKAPPARRGTGNTISLEPRSREDEFGFRYSGFVDVPTDGIYAFTLRCSPRGRLAIAGQEIVESQGRRRERTGMIALARGLHPITFSIYFRSDVDKTLEINYAGPGIARRPLSEAPLSYVEP